MFRFFQFTTKDFTDYTRAEYLTEARKIFKRFYPKKKGEIKEIWMVNFNKHNKSFKKE